MKDIDSMLLARRVKKLSTLHLCGKFLHQHSRSLDQRMENIVALLPGACSDPEFAAASITLRGKVYRSGNYGNSDRILRRDFDTASGLGGSVVLAHVANPDGDPAPFHGEELELVEDLCEMLRAHLQHILTDESLVAARKDLEAQVVERTADLRRLASRLTLVEEKERRRIAGNLHDHVGQALAFIKIKMIDFKGNAVFAGFEEDIDEVLKLFEQTIRYTRELTGEISPPVLYELGLEPALDWLAEYFSKRRDFAVKFSTRGSRKRLPEELQILLFKSARELLSNSLKHSGRPSAELDLNWEKKNLKLAVRDKGRGFDARRLNDRVDEAFGLFSIRERLRDLGGSVEVDSDPASGCRVTLTLPLPGGSANG